MDNAEGIYTPSGALRKDVYDYQYIVPKNVDDELHKDYNNDLEEYWGGLSDGKAHTVRDLIRYARENRDTELNYPDEDGFDNYQGMTDGEIYDRMILDDENLIPVD